MADQFDCAAATESGGVDLKVDFGFCAICLDKILLQETALVKGCEHAYCVTCILRWASYKDNPSCPQCKHPFESLNVHRSLDGCIHDYMFEESVILLLRATWFVPLPTHAPLPDEPDDLSHYYTEEPELYELYDFDEDLDLPYFNQGSSSGVRIGNRRWGDTGFVRAGRREARPVRQGVVVGDEGEVGVGRNKGGRVREKKEKEKERKDGEASGSGSGASKDLTGRRAKRAIKREAADRAAAEKHKQILQRMGRA
ncbi:hypothetical protein LUZ60_003671 [Juncus effusus]|nr:hypothetical protein LUZ60_003671 [Juncus effusus]